MNKLTLRTVVSPYNDTTKGSVLEQNELDNNFITLKGEVIASASTSGGTTSLVKYNGEVVSFPSGGGSSGSGDTIIPVSKFLIFKIAPNTSNVLEAGDMVQGIVENKKIEAIYLGGDVNTLSSFNIINFIDLSIPTGLTLSFNNIDNSMSNLGIADKYNVNDWNNLLASRGIANFDSVFIDGNSAILSVDDVSTITNLDLFSMELSGVDIRGLNSTSFLSLDDNQLTSFDPIVALPNSLTYLTLSRNQLTNFDPSISLPNNLINLDLSFNQLTNFDPTIPLPDTLTGLYISNNQLTNFDPSIALPSSLDIIRIDYNQLTSFNPSVALPSSLTQLWIIFNQLTSFDPSIPLPNGFNRLVLTDNQLTSFNPSVPLPNSLFLIFLDNNQITTSSWNDDTAWIPNVGNNGVLGTGNNTNIITGTTTESLLLSKGWTVNV